MVPVINLNFMLDAGYADFADLEGDATFEVEPDFGLDITAVDTTLGDEDVQPFYPKDMKHGGFDMSKLVSGYFFNFNFVYFGFSFL